MKSTSLRQAIKKENENFKLVDKIEIIFFLCKDDYKNVNEFIKTNPNEIIKYFEFEKYSDLEKYLKEISESKFTQTEIFLITSGSIGNELNNKGIFIQQEITNVFLYTWKKEPHKEWSKHNLKIKKVSTQFRTIEKEVKKLLVNRRKSSSFNKQLEIYFYNCSESFYNFIFNECLLNLFKKYKFNNENSKTDFIDYCKANYELYQGTKDEFEELLKDVNRNKFNNKNIILWFTNESFFNKLVNKVLREDNWIDIFKIRFGLTNLTDALSTYNNKSLNGKLYRTSLLNRSEISEWIENLKLKPIFIHIREYVSAFSNLNFTKKISCNSNDLVVSVLFIIDNNFKSIPIINNFEYLLDSNTLFQLVNVVKSEDENFEFIINLSICNPNNMTECHISKNINCCKILKELDNITYNHDYFYLFKIFYSVGKYNDLLNLLYEFDEENFSDINTKADYFNWYGNVYYAKGDLDCALQNYKSGLNLRKSKLENDNLDTAISYNYIGYTYNAKGDLDNALKYYKLCLEIRKLNLNNSHADTATLYNKIGDIYYAKGDLDNALKHYKLCLKILESNSGNDCPSSEISFSNIAKVYYTKGDINSAIKYYQSCLKLEELKLGDNLPYTTLSHSNISLLYRIKGDLDSALKYLLFCSYFNQGRECKAKGNLNSALEYFLLCLKIRESQLGFDHPLTATLYYNIGLLYKEKDDIQSALKYFILSVNIFESKLGTDHLFTALSYNNIGRVHYVIGDSVLAEKYYKKCLNIRESKLGIDHPLTIQTQSEFMNLFV